MSDVKSPRAVESSADTLAPATTHNQKAGFWTRRKKIGCAIGVATFIVLFLVVFLPILFLVIGPKIAQKNINSSVLTFRDASITNPTNTTFDLALKIDVTNAGSIKATLTHTTPMRVAWINPLTGAEIPILAMNLPPFTVDDGTGTIDTKVSGVTVLDQTALTLFNKFLIGGPAFQWRLTSGISAHALGRDYDGLSLDKIVTLQGMGAFQGTTIKQFALPGYPATQSLPQVPIVLNATLFNPSPVGLELDITTFDVATLVAGTSVPLGVVTSTQKTFINGMGNTTLPLSGYLFALANLPIQVFGLLPAVLLGAANINVTVTPTAVGAESPVSWISGALVGANLNATMGYAAPK
ncbi:hypothetical protein HDU87_000524 [Geranomyces variabilis]|uniref:Uncharacterized protein n=1 Tax=Geranomyces variabilis TaxID=109894 RepID=A0AAD5XJH1_9FUNG|nr:hypothetical protein HDU87_000524 [Geranomyces variabilis]